MALQAPGARRRLQTSPSVWMNDSKVRNEVFERIMQCLDASSDCFVPFAEICIALTIKGEQLVDL